MLAGGKRLSPTEPTGETGGLRSNSDEVEKITIATQSTPHHRFDKRSLS